MLRARGAANRVCTGFWGWRSSEVASPKEAHREIDPLSQGGARSGNRLGADLGDKSIDRVGGRRHGIGGTCRRYLAGDLASVRL